MDWLDLSVFPLPAQVSQAKFGMPGGDNVVPARELAHPSLATALTWVGPYSLLFRLSFFFCLGERFIKVGKSAGPVDRSGAHGERYRCSDSSCFVV